MLYDALEDPGSATPSDLRAAYEAELRSVVDALGVDRVAAETEIEAARLERLADGDAVPDLALSDAAAIAALAPDAPDADAVAATVRDHVLMGMTTGVLDVDAVASNVDLDLSGQEVQQAIEGRVPLTLEQLAAIQQFVDSRR